MFEKIETVSKSPKFKVDDRVQITRYENILSNVYTKKCSREIFVIYSVLKTNPWTYKIISLNGENIIGSFYEKELSLSKL